MPDQDLKIWGPSLFRGPLFCMSVIGVMICIALLFFGYPSWLCWLWGLVVVILPFVRWHLPRDQVRIVIAHHVIEGPPGHLPQETSVVRPQKISINLCDIDLEKSCSAPSVLNLFSRRHIWARDGRGIVIESDWFWPSEIKEIISCAISDARPR